MKHLLHKVIGSFLFHHGPHQPGTAIVQIENLTVRYESGLALDHISFTLKPGQRVAVVGPNGAGKTTLFKAMAGLLKPTEGAVRIYGKDPDDHICIGYVPQRSQVDWSFPVNVLDVVMMGRVGKLGLFRVPGAHDRMVVRKALEMVGMTDLANRRINQLSGGQQQRVFIARALAQEAKLLLMDEPMIGLDAKSSEDIFRILDNLRELQVTVMISLHDLKMASERFEAVMLLNNRLLGFGAPANVITSENLMAAYGDMLHLVKDEGGFHALGDTCCKGGEER